MSDLEDLVARECELYRTAEQRAAYRAGMSTAAAACDNIAKRMGDRKKIDRTKAEVATMCGDVITALRSNVTVPR